MSFPHPPILSVAALAASGDDEDDRNDASNRPNPTTPAHFLDSPAAFPQQHKNEDENDDEEASDLRRGRGRPPKEISGPGPHQCTLCNKFYLSAKALHGHMRSHPERGWRGSVRPSMQPGRESEAADSLLMLSGKDTAGIDGPPVSARKYVCVCGKEFDSRQALGGHRASHKNQLGCFARSRVDGPPRPSSGPDVGPEERKRTVALVVGDVEGVEEVGRRQRRRRELDLNLSPPESSSEMEGSGRASSTTS